MQMCYPASGTLSTCELLSVDSLLAIINELHSHCHLHTAGGSHDHSNAGSHDHSSSTQPTPEELLLLRQRKKVMEWESRSNVNDLSMFSCWSLVAVNLIVSRLKE